MCLRHNLLRASWGQYTSARIEKMLQTRRVPVVAIAIVVGGSAVAATTAILVRRYLATRGASEAEAGELAGRAEALPDGKPDAELVTSYVVARLPRLSKTTSEVML